MKGFNKLRSKLYKEALKEFPEARVEDIEIMKKYLAPKKGETILEIGSGSGIFSGVIADLVGKDGKLIVSDPSKDQLDEIKLLKRGNIEILQKAAEDINLENSSIDAIWSFGAMHHSFKKREALEVFKRILKKDGRIVIGDVFEGSKLAKHFDERVDKYCVTGHKVEFWKEIIVNRLFNEIGLSSQIIDIPIHWRFKSKEDIGKFLYKLHAMTKTTEREVLSGAEEILGIEKRGDSYLLNWPMKLIITEKLK